MNTSKLRPIVAAKFGGKCAYCGTELVKGWHVDHLIPCRRKFKIIPGHHTGPVGADGFQTMWIPQKTVPDGYDNPEANHIDNLIPSCASCNINKHSDTLEAFRDRIFKFVNSLNQYSVQYQIAKRYGLVKETENPVIFYFERF